MATEFELNLAPTIKGLQEAGAAARAFNATLQDTANAGKLTFQAVAQANVDAKNQLAEQNRQLREGQDLYRETAARLREIAKERKALEDTQRKTAAGEDTLKLNKALEENQRRYEQVLKTLANIKEENNQIKLRTAESAKEIQRTADAEKLLAAAAKDTAVQQREQAKAAAEAGRQESQAAKEAARQQSAAAKDAKDREVASRNAAKAADQEARAAGVLGKLEQQLLDLTEKRVKATSEIEVQGYNKQIADVNNQIKNLKADTGEVAPKQGFFDSLITKAGAAVAAFFAVNKVIGVIKEGVNDFKALSGIESTFKALAGSAQAGGQELAFIAQQANKLGLELIPTAKAYTGLFAASKEANIPLEVTRSLFIGLTDAGRVLGRSQGEVESALRAVEQMISKGTVSSQELKLQLGDALPGAFGLAAKAAGLTTAEFTKQLESGKILAADFLPKLAKQLRDTYGGATADAATQTTANLGRINTFLTNQSAKLGAAFAPAIKGIADLVSAQETAAQRSSRLASSYTTQYQNLDSLRNTLRPLVDQYNELSEVSNRSTGQQRELDGVIQQIAKSVPGAVTQFDAYGKAIDINTKAVQEFIRAQENVVRYNNREALKQNSADLVNLINQADFLQKQLNKVERDAQGLARRRIDINVDGDIAQSSLLSVEESAKITNDLTAKLSKVQDDIRANLDNRQLLRGKSPLLPLGDDAANDKAIQGLIEKQQKLIKDLQDRQKAATQENQGNGKDFLFGKGGLNQQLEDAQKELDRLLGKVDKASQAAENRLLAALRALESERRKLRNELNKQEIEDLKDQGQARAREQLRQDNLAILELERVLKEREAAVRKAGGKGANADGVIDGVQQEQLGKLRLLAIDRYNAELIRIAQEVSDKLFELQEESGAKQIEEIERRYEKEVLAARNNKDVILALEQAKQRELLALRQQQTQQAINDQATIASNMVVANTGEFFGEGTGVSVIEAKRAEKEALLKIEQKAAQDTLNNTLLLTGAQAQIERSAAAARLAQIKNDLKALEREKASHKSEDFFYKLILGEEDSNENRQRIQEDLSIIVNSTISALQQITQANLQAAQSRVDAATRNIDDLKSQLSAEIELRKTGAASNIQGIQDQIRQEKKARQEALKDQREAARQQQLIQDLTAVSSITLAAANILQGWSTIPFVGQVLGAVAIAAMIASFVAVKAKAKNAAQSTGSFFKGGLADNISEEGGYTGDGNPQQESRKLGKKSYEYHLQEYVVPHEPTRKHRGFLEALHHDKLHTLTWQDPTLMQIRAKVEPDPELPKQLLEKRENTIKLQYEVSVAPLKAELAETNRRLDEAVQQLKYIPKETVRIIPAGEVVVETHNHETNTHTRTHYPA
jgi:tape measure domain-containing protein